MPLINQMLLLLILFLIIIIFKMIFMKKTLNLIKTEDALFKFQILFLQREFNLKVISKEKYYFIILI